MRLSQRFSDAAKFALALHREQTRKQSGVPYAAHLLGVAAIVLEDGGSEDEAIGALLHDAIEDQGPSFAGGSDGLRREIRERFGAEVLAIVEGCTDADTIPKPPWRERKERYLAHVRAASASTRRVSCADKIYNARAIVADHREHGERVWERFRGGREGTLWYYRALADEFTARGPKRLAGELARTVAEMESLARRG